MRNARAKDYWRAIKRIRKGAPYLSRLRFDSIPGLAPIDIEPTSPLIVICGANGTGKSSLLSGIHCALVGATPSAYAWRLGSAQIIIQESLDCTSSQYTSGARSAAEEKKHKDSVALVDGPTHISEVLSWLRATENLTELLEQTGGAELSREDRLEISQVTGKLYSRIVMYELEEADVDTTRPYIQVETTEASYDCTTMGFGEFATFYLFWLFRRLPEQGILLIEEPENFIPPRAASCLMDVLAKVIVRRKMQAILVTHSEHILDRAPNNCIFYTSKRSQGYTLTAASRNDRHLKSIGLTTVKKDLILVEDKFAKLTLDSVIDLFSQNVSPTFAIVSANGTSNIDGTLKHFPNGEHAHRIVGVFDGDEKGADRPNTEWNYFYLPGTSSPDAHAKVFALANPEKVAEFCNAPAQDLIEVFDRHQSADPHDFFENAASELSLDTYVLSKSAVTAWLSYDSSAIQESAALVDEIVRALG